MADFLSGLDPKLTYPVVGFTAAAGYQSKQGAVGEGRVSGGAAYGSPLYGYVMPTVSGDIYERGSARAAAGILAFTLLPGLGLATVGLPFIPVITEHIEYDTTRNLRNTLGLSVPVAGVAGGAVSIGAAWTRESASGGAADGVSFVLSYVPLCDLKAVVR